MSDLGICDTDSTRHVGIHRRRGDCTGFKTEPAASEGGTGPGPGIECPRCGRNDVPLGTKDGRHIYGEHDCKSGWRCPAVGEFVRSPVASVEGQRMQPEEFPVELNKEQLASIEGWSKNSMVGDIWSNAQARKHNLTIFARKIMSDARTSSDNSASVPDVEGMQWIETELWNHAHALALDLNLPHSSEAAIHQSMKAAIIAAHSVPKVAPVEGMGAREWLLTACRKTPSR